MGMHRGVLNDPQAAVHKEYEALLGFLIERAVMKV
jgi:hypothetical protein